MARAGFEYSTAPGSSVYPIKPGVVFRLSKTKLIHNRLINKICPHETFIWIQRLPGLRGEAPTKDRRVRVLYFCRPEAVEHHESVILNERTVKFSSIVKQLKRSGYTIVSQRAKFYYSEWSYKNFYRQIGAL